MENQGNNTVYNFSYPKDYFEKFDTDDNVVKICTDFGMKEISLILLNNIIRLDGFYDDKYFCINISNNELDKSEIKYSYNKVEIVSFIDKAASENLYFSDDNLQKKLAKLKKQTDLDIFFKKNINQDFNIKIDGVNYSIKISDIYDFLNMSEIDYLNFFEEYSNRDVPLNCFCYSVLKFIKQNDIFSKYKIPNNVNNIYSDLATYKFIDFEALNKLNSTHDKTLNDISVNPLLRKEIISDMPESYSEMEKAIYIYIKMCKTLSYDEEFYAFNQQGCIAQYHENVFNIKNITPEQNEVVCYEFTSIYGKFLNELGINYTKISKNGNEFGGGHSNLVFKVDKYLIEADAVTSILRGDLFQAKCNQKLVGLNCINENQSSINEFKNIFSNVYGDFSDNNNLSHIEMLNNNEDILFYDKIGIFLNDIKKCNLSGIDYYSYILHLRHVLFEEDELDSNVNVTIVRNNKPNVDCKNATSLAIITCNNFDMYYDVELNSYFLADSRSGVKEVDRDELLYKFRCGDLQYVSSKDNRIPGIKFGEDLYKQKTKKKI